MFFPHYTTLPQLQDDATDDRLDPDEPDEDPTCLLENRSPGDILHIDKDDAERISGALLNQYNQKLKKCKNYTCWLMVCKQYIVLNHVLSEKNAFLKPIVNRFSHMTHQIKA